MRMLMITTATTVIWFNMLSFILESQILIDFWFQMTPYSACAMLRADFFLGTLTKNLLLILTFRLFLTMDSLKFQRMNHEKVFKISLTLLIILTFLEIMLIFLSNGTLCSNLRLLQTLSKIYDVNIPDEEYQNTAQPPLLAIQCALTCIPEVSRSFILYTRRLKARKIASIPGAVPPTHQNRRSFSLPGVTEVSILPISTCSDHEVSVDFGDGREVLDVIQEEDIRPPILISINRLSQHQHHKQAWIHEMQLDDGINGMNIKPAELKNLTIYFYSCMSTIPLLTYIMNQSENLLIVIQISSSLGLHVLPVIWVINSNDIMKYMIRKIKNFLDQIW